jgi:hypothetical protein
MAGFKHSVYLMDDELNVLQLYYQGTIKFCRHTFITIFSAHVTAMGFKPTLYLQIINCMFYHCATRVQQGHLDIEGQLMSEIVDDVPDRGRVRIAQNDLVEGKHHKSIPLDER